MRVLLINPNRYASPPVPPIGLEYLLSSLVAQGHEARILDLCFSENLYEEINHYGRSFQPDIAGVTVRNVDTVLYHTNEFFLDQIREIVGHLKRCHSLRVMIGGAGLLSNPHGILGYLQADFATKGPAEATVSDILRKIRQDSLQGKVFQGVYSGSNPCYREPCSLNYKKYLEKGGVAGFETQCLTAAALAGDQWTSFSTYETALLTYRQSC